MDTEKALSDHEVVRLMKKHDLRYDRGYVRTIQEVQDQMIAEGKLFLDGFGIAGRTRAHIEAFVEKEIRMINKRRKGQGKSEISGKVSALGQDGIFVDVELIPHREMAA